MSFDPSSVDVEHLLDVLGIENVAQATQHEMKFSCPFPNHAGGDETPSCYMNIESTAFFCHACKERGTAVDFAAYVLDITPLEATRLLRQAYMPGSIHPDARHTAAEVRKILTREPEVEQPLLDEALVEGFAMNWYEAERNPGVFPPADYFLGRGFDPGTLTDWQFGWDPFTHRIVFPIRDIEGRLVGFKGRATESERKPRYLVLGDGPKGTYWGFARYQPSRVVFGANRYAQGVQGPLIVCEGELNAIAMTMKAFIPAVAINGSYFSTHHARIIKRIAGPKGVILFLDSDEAGQLCTWGWHNARGEWHPGIVEQLCPHMPVKLVPDHDSDPAEMRFDEIKACLDESGSHLLAAVRK